MTGALSRRDFIYGTVGLKFCFTLPLAGCVYGARESGESSFVTSWVNIEPGGGIVIHPGSIFSKSRSPMAESCPLFS